MKKLSFNESGEFKIVQFTDLHIGAYPLVEKDLRTLQLIEKIIKEEEPDLIVLTGDLIWTKGIQEPSKSYESILKLLEKSRKPFAIVPGNHDTEETITRTDLLNMEAGMENMVTKEGAVETGGRNNYSVPIYATSGKEVASVLYMLDSGAQDAQGLVGIYDWILPEQIAWYVEESKQYHKGSNGVIPSLAFFHIPLPEYKNITLDNMVGFKNEAICSPELNSGFYTALFEQGDVMGTFVGHDHDNDFCGLYHGISLAYGRVTGTQLMVN